MIFRLLGGAVVFVSCTLLGIYYSMKDSHRIADLSEFKKALNLLKGEIEFNRRPLPEALEYVAKKVETEVGALFSGVSKNLEPESGYDTAVAWAEALKTTLAETYLTREDIDNIGHLGETLGHVDIETQLSGMAMVNEYIEAQTDKLRTSEYGNKRLYRSAGVLVGFLIVVMLL